MLRFGLRSIVLLGVCVSVALGQGAVGDEGRAGGEGRDVGFDGLRGVRVLVFSKTAGFRHASIEAGGRVFSAWGREHSFEVVSSEDASVFDDDLGKRFDAVVFLNTTGDVLDGEQEAVFERFIRGGGGYLGIHAASDTEYGWAFYGELVGAYFAGHPRVQEARIRVVDHAHPATAHLGATWTRADEWYNFRAVPKDVHVLLRLDESSYEGGEMGEDHPIAWWREMGKGRAIYTGMGHTEDSFLEPDFRKHLLGSLLWITRRDGGQSQPVPTDPR